MVSKWGQLKREDWPQNTLEVPKAGAQYMPPINLENARFAQRESFTMSGSFLMPDPTVKGQVFSLFLPTDQDGDFWCDQIYMTAWNNGLIGPTGQLDELVPPSLVQISDARTGRRLCYPEGISSEFLSTVTLFEDKPGVDFSTEPLPAGFRPTSTLPQPFCFTRQGGIQVDVTALYNWPSGGNNYTVDIAFGGWKEYAHASA